MRREYQKHPYQEESTYQKWQKHRRFAAFALPITFILCFVSSLIQHDIDQNELEAKLLVKAESYTGENKSFYDSKFSELKGSMGESKARKKAIELTDKNIEYKYRIDGFNDEKRAFFNEKFNEYKNSMDEFSAKEKAINDTDEEFDKRDKELQKKYDDQKQYEEWIAWQQSEKEKAEKAELQKKYDDQAKYEEWIAWKKSEEEKANAEKNKKRAGLNRLEENGQIQYINLGNDTYNIIITAPAKLDYSGNNFTDLINYATQDKHERNILSSAKQCMELVQIVQDAELNVNNYTINLTGDVVDGKGYKYIDNVVICEISGSAKFVRGDPYSFYNKCSRYWTIKGL